MEREEDEKHRMIIKCFGDQAGPHSPFSIHTLVSLGASTGKRAGDWYGPASVAHILSQAVKLAATSHNEFKNLTVYVAQDCAGNFKYSLENNHFLSKSDLFKFSFSLP